MAFAVEGDAFQVTVTGSGAAQVLDAAGTAIQGTDYTFTKPYVPGYSYSVSIFIDGVAYTDYAVTALGVYTIFGADITGDIEIFVAREQVDCAVSVTGFAAGVADGYASGVAYGNDYTLTIAPKPENNYLISATIDTPEGKIDAVINNNGNNTYTVTNVTGYLTFTIEIGEDISADDIEISEYLQMNNSKVWLVKASLETPEGWVLTYDDNPMYWAEEHNAYCYLVMANEQPKNVKDLIGIAAGDAVTITYDGDVNSTSITDMNDAQMVYNIYNILYTDDFLEIDMNKMLSVDMNKDGCVDIRDAVAIVSVILQ
ncbi:MAG: hypothetical protein IJB47_07385 [Oscillospiraceae bacterium]|nr:hypothetical protein [Oscillospiraceae bacterium]